MSATVIQSGDYLLELDTGFDVGSFRLDDTTKGVLDNTTYLLGPTTQFADITQFVTAVNYKRGRQKPDDQFGAGTLSFVMRDETGILGPYDTTSPYYDPDNLEPGLAPMRRVRFSREGEYLFVGTVTAYDYNFEKAGPNIVTVNCADDFYKLAQAYLDEWNVTVETTSQRLTSLLALSEVDYTGTTSIATSSIDLGHDSSYTVTDGTNALEYVNRIQEAEQGRIFMSRDGTLTFQTRIGTTLSAPVVSFDDNGGTHYDSIEIEFDADNVINRSQVINLGGTTATADDLTSQAKYFIQTKSVQGSILDDVELQDLADYLIVGEPSPRYTALGTKFAMLSASERDDVATIDIGDTISIQKTIPGLGTQIGEESSVEGIEAYIDFQSGHRVKFYTSPTTIVYELILDDATYGVMDSTNVLG
ncbi:MAG: hypothetical protein ACO3IP_09330 [Burkholderiaceae bacterium]